MTFHDAMGELSAPSHPTCHDVMQALYKRPKNDTFGGLTPPISYTSSGPQPPVTCFFTIQVKGGSFQGARRRADDLQVVSNPRGLVANGPLLQGPATSPLPGQVEAGR